MVKGSDQLGPAIVIATSSYQHQQVRDLLIDATGLGPGTTNTGTGRILEHLVASMIEQRQDARLTVAGEYRNLLGVAKNDVRWVDDLSSPHLPSVLFRPRQLLANRELSAVFARGRRVVLYQLDTIAVEHDYFPSERHGMFVRNVVRAALRSADVVATLSHSSAADILRFCPDVEPRRLAVVPCGVTVEAPPSPVRPAEAPMGPFVLVLSASFAHKNRPFAIDVYSELRKRGYSGALVLAGPEPVYGSTLAEEKARSSCVANGVVRLGPVSDSEKWWLLKSAEAVLYPSTMEGFGLIPFEAAAAGTPCLMADVSCFREVCGPDALLANGFDVDEWASVILRWIESPPEAAGQVDALRSNGARLNWNAAANAAWKAMDLSVSLPSRRPDDWEGGWSVQPFRHSVGLSTAARAVQQAHRAKARAARLVSERLGRSEPPRGY